METLAESGTFDRSWTTNCVSTASERGGAYARFYTFTLNESADVTITLESSVDTYLYLHEGTSRDSASYLCENDDYEGPVVGESCDNIDFDLDAEVDSGLVASLDYGVYIIEATTYKLEDPVNFRLKISDFTAAPAATPEPIQRTACHIPRSGSDSYPLTLSGTWTSSCTLDDGTPYILDEWKQQGTGVVTITAISDADPNLTLFEIDDSKSTGEDGWATQLAYNDDIDFDAGDYDAQVGHTLEDGKHYLVSVKPYNASTRASFTLTYTSSIADLGWAAGYASGGQTTYNQSQVEIILESATTK